MIKFPIIDKIEPFVKLVNNYKNLVEIDDGNTLIFDYIFPDKDEFSKNPLMREMRGLIFDKKTKKVISRRYHKFYNLNEVKETEYDNIDWNKNFVVLEKLDGSMISFYKTSDRLIRIGTKRGETDVTFPVKDFVRKYPRYFHFSDNIIDEGYTPIFEWCSPLNRVVIDYNLPRLVLTAVRNNKTGEYLKYSELQKLKKQYNIDVVKSIITNDVDSLIKSLKTDKNIEGYVIRFDDGMMIKLKTDWYLKVSRLNLAYANSEKKYLETILSSTFDDIESLIDFDLIKNADRYKKDINNALLLNAEKVADWFIEDNKNGLSRKEIALKLGGNPFSGYYFNLLNKFSGKEFTKSMLIDETYESFIKSIFLSGRMEKIRYLINNIDYRNYFI